MSGHKCNSPTFAIVDPQERAMRSRSHDFSSSLGNLVAVEFSRAKHIPVHFVLLGIVIYRLYFHPLARFPGPFWAKISTLPSWWQARKQKRHLWLLSLQEKYGRCLVTSKRNLARLKLIDPGTTFRHRPDAMCINTPAAYRHVYGPRGNVKKGISYEVWQRTVDAQNTWSTTSIETHARKRKSAQSCLLRQCVTQLRVVYSQQRGPLATTAGPT